MFPFRYLSRLFLVFLVVTPMLLNGCSYIPWIGDDEEDDLAFEEDFPFEDEDFAREDDARRSEDDFFADESAGAESGGGGFASIDQETDRNELRGDMENLQIQQEALISKVRELEEILSMLEPKIAATQERLEGSLASAETRSEFLEPEVEELKNQVAQLNAEIQQMKGGGGGVGMKSSKTRVARGGKTPPEYNKALDAYRSGNYDESILLFQNLALSNPPTSLQDNIVFWIGNNYLKLEMYDDAIKQYETVLNRYPRANKAHDSRYMLGVSYFKKGESSRAVEVLEAALKVNPPSEVKGKILAQLREIQ